MNVETMCIKKNRYSYDRALEVAAHQTRKHAHFLRIYKCPNCGMYHLAHKKLAN